MVQLIDELHYSSSSKKHRPVARWMDTRQSQGWMKISIIYFIEPVLALESGFYFKYFEDVFSFY